MTSAQTPPATTMPETGLDATPAQAKPGIEPRAMIKRLEAECAAFRDCKPLALRIDNAILERFPEFERKVLRVALRMHTASTRYLKAVERSAQRFDLDGNPAGEVTDEQRAHAAQLLKERFAAVAKQQREKRGAEEAERRKQEKLQQLMSKFGR